MGTTFTLIFQAGMSIENRARAYVLSLPPSIAKSGGHSAAFRVASSLYHGFSMEREAALSIMREWNQQRANPPWSEAELAHKIDSSAAAPSRYSRGWLLREKAETSSPVSEGVAPLPTGTERTRIPKYNPEKAEQFAAGCPFEITLDLLAKRSPVTIPDIADQNAGTAELFLSEIYQESEKILVFTDFRSQGDFLWTVGEGGSRLARARNIPPAPSRLPGTAQNGVWFLIQPVTGEWTIQTSGNASRYGRRHGDCVTAWRYLLLESDDAPESVWLRCLVQLPLEIVAMYSSGGRSIHALVKVDADSKAEYDAKRDVIRALLPILGADPAATTGVRLSRLPGCRRGNNLQRLIWLDPNPPENLPIIDRIAP